jgi:arylsulfatase A-like enzyme
MDRREFLLGGAVSALKAQVPRKPNLVLLLVDHWRGQALTGADPNISTPALDRMAAAGIVFSRAYTANPTGSPARAALFTGRFPHACGVLRDNVRLPSAERTLGEALSKAGYATGYIGKWHLDGEAKPGFVPPGSRRKGFAYWAAFNCGHRYFDSVYFRDEDKPVRGRGFEPDYQTDLAIEFIRGNSGRPFFLCISWGPPHPPRTPPPAFSTRYDARKLRLRDNVPASHVGNAREALAGYYGLCSAVDRDAGRILDTLRETESAGDTVVVFTSVHGDMLGSHGLDLAGVPYEESVRIPLLVSYPRMIKAGQVSPMPVSGVDLMPTLLSIAGVPVPADVQGRNHSQSLLSGAGSDAESIYCQGQLGSPQEWRMVIRGLDKIVVDRAFKTTHLYNLGQDPYELENLASDSHNVRLDEMTALLRDWAERLSDGILPSGLKIRP